MTLLGPGDMTSLLADTVGARSEASSEDDVTWKTEELRG